MSHVSKYDKHCVCMYYDKAFLSAFTVKVGSQCAACPGVTLDHSSETSAKLPSHSASLPPRTSSDQKQNIPILAMHSRGSPLPRHALHMSTFTAVAAVLTVTPGAPAPVFVFTGLVFTNGTEPKISTNITDSEVITNMTNILTAFGRQAEEDYHDLDTSGMITSLNRDKMSDASFYSVS